MKYLKSKKELLYDAEKGLTATIEERVKWYKHYPNGDYLFVVDQIAKGHLITDEVVEVLDESTGDVITPYEPAVYEMDKALGNGGGSVKVPGIVTGYTKIYKASTVKSIVSQLGITDDILADFPAVSLSIVEKLQLTAIQMNPRFGSAASDWELI